MTKTEFTKTIAKKAGLTNAQAVAAYDAFISTVTDALKQGEKVSLVGFGTFELKNVPAKDGVNPPPAQRSRSPRARNPL